MELLESPLLGPEGEQWKKEERKVPEDFEKWVDAQLFSEKASREYASYQNLLVPIDTELVKPHVVETVWKYVNLVGIFCKRGYFRPLISVFRTTKVCADKT